MAFNQIYQNKKVLITGHTGFKGSWLSVWLLQLGAEVYGISNDVPSQPSMFEVLELESKIHYQCIDVTNFNALNAAIQNIQPDFIFHLAAQAIVSTSYTNPILTIQSNTLGTAHVLECVRLLDKKVAVVIITSDKVYDNVEQLAGYVESDLIGGKDIYSASKGAAELIFKGYWHSFFKDKHQVRIAVARAGNVIGGGDWSTDRIVADCMRKWSMNQTVTLRNPNATRPWQHVLEPLSGYLLLGQLLYEELLHVNGQAYNLGPYQQAGITVLDVVNKLSSYFTGANTMVNVQEDASLKEAKLLQLNCDKAVIELNWRATFGFDEMTKLIADWYKNFYNNDGSVNMYDFTNDQIVTYHNHAFENNLSWTK
jgi:CDP-glucose 4,6-dehydratase